jgi:hypothetical protein
MNRNPSGWATADYVKTPDGWSWATQQATHSVPDRPLGVSLYPENPAEELLATAVAWWDTSKYVAGDRFLRNLGYGGSGLNARLGSNIAPNSNDPTYLPWNNFNYLFLPDSNSSLVCIAPATAASYVAYSLDGTTATGAVTGGLSFTFSTAGSWTQIDLLDASSVVVASFNANTGGFTQQATTTLAVAALAADLTITVASAANIIVGSIIQINAEQMLVTAIAGSVLTVTRGLFSSVVVAQAINSIIYLPRLYTDSFSVAWHFNTPATQNLAGSTNRKRGTLVVRPTFLLGTDDFFQIIGNQQHSAFSFGSNQPFTVFVSYRPQDERTGGAGTTPSLLTKGSWALAGGNQNNTFTYSDGTSSVNRQINSTPNPAPNEPVTVFGRRAKNIGLISNNATPPAFQQVVAGLYTRRDSKNTIPQARLTSTETNMNNGRIGNSTLETRIGTGPFPLFSAAGAFCSMEFLGAAVFRKPLTNTEMDLISRYYGSL